MPSDLPLLNILVVEDNPEDEFLIRRLLRKAAGARYRLSVVHGRGEALAALEKNFDACLMDYDLGSYTGTDLLETVNAGELSGPIVLLTGHSDFEIDAAALELGVTDFVCKAEVSAPLLDRTIRYARRQFQDQRELSYLAHYDGLTGLLNRHAFLQEVPRWLAEDGRSDEQIYLLYVDLDGFKSINDSWGHDVGDRVLRHAAKSLTHSVRESDLVARYGGDELVAVVALAEGEEIAVLAERVLDSTRRPLGEQGRNIVVTASIGVVHSEHARDDASQLLRLADHAMYAAKRAGRDAFRVFSGDTPITSLDRADMEADLRAALQKNDLYLAYQPQFRLQDGRLMGAEALARWEHPQRGDISPGEFIPVAEQCGLIRALTRWSLESGISTLAQWLPLLPPDFRLAINISPAQMLDPDFGDLVTTILDEHEVPARYLRLEITENFFLDEHAAGCLQNLRGSNLSLALDDFGTGYSSLSQLVRLPIDTLKIDLSFVRDMLDDERMAALARAVVSVGEELGMTVIAEGVEREAQASKLRDFGCNQVQGFLFGRPQIAAEFVSHLHKDSLAESQRRTVHGK